VCCGISCVSVSDVLPVRCVAIWDAIQYLLAYFSIVRRQSYMGFSSITFVLVVDVSEDETCFISSFVSVLDEVQYQIVSVNKVRVFQNRSINLNLQICNYTSCTFGLWT